MKFDESSKHRLGWRPAEIAKMLGVSLAFIRKEIRTKKIKVTKFGTAILILRGDLDDYIESKKDTVDDDSKD